PWFLVLFVPFNLLLSLYLRNLILGAFDRNRFRELFAVIIIAISVVPQWLLRMPNGHKFQDYLLKLANSIYSPWHAVADLGLGFASVLDFAIIACWITGVYFLARFQFLRSLTGEAGFRPDVQPLLIGRARPEGK